MKKLILTAVLCFAVLPWSAMSQEKIKVVDKSAKKVPQWVNSTASDYIITSATAKDPETARNMCLDNVRRYVIESVAENVKFSSETNISQKTVSEGIVSFLDQYSSNFQTQAADVPFLKGISASKVEDYYWEKRQNKTTKETYYVYSIKYPFPSVELKSLVYEFEKRDKEVYGQYLSLEKGLRGVGSVEEIDRAIRDLNPVIEYFFDDTRKNAAKNLQQSYRNLYQNITFSPVSNELGRYTMRLTLDGRTITTSQRLTAKADCATELSVFEDGENIVVTYDYSTCYPEEENAVSVPFRFGGRSATHKFFIPLKETKVEIWPQKTIYLNAAEKDGSTITNINVRISMQSDTHKEYVVRSVTLEVPGLSEPIFIDYLNQTMTNRDSNLNLTWIGTAQVLESQNGRLNLLRGNMEIEIPGQDIYKRVDFSLPFQANW